MQQQCSALRAVRCPHWQPEAAGACIVIHPAALDPAFPSGLGRGPLTPQWRRSWQVADPPMCIRRRGRAPVPFRHIPRFRLGVRHRRANSGRGPASGSDGGAATGRSPTPANRGRRGPARVPRSLQIGDGGRGPVPVPDCGRVPSNLEPHFSRVRRSCRLERRGHRAPPFVARGSRGQVRRLAGARMHWQVRTPKLSHVELECHAGAQAPRP